MNERMKRIEKKIAKQKLDGIKRLPGTYFIEYLGHDFIFRPTVIGKQMPPFINPSAWKMTQLMKILDLTPETPLDGEAWNQRYTELMFV